MILCEPPTENKWIFHLSSLSPSPLWLMNLFNEFYDEKSILCVENIFVGSWSLSRGFWVCPEWSRTTDEFAPWKIYFHFHPTTPSSTHEWTFWTSCLGAEVENILCHLHRVETKQRGEVITTFFTAQQRRWAKGKLKERLDSCFSYFFSSFTTISFISSNLKFFYCISRRVHSSLQTSDTFTLFTAGERSTSNKNGQLWNTMACLHTKKERIGVNSSWHRKKGETCALWRLFMIH